MIEIPIIVTSIWESLQPFLPVIATKAAEEIGKTTISELWKVIEKKFSTNESAKDILQDLINNPQDLDLQGAFRAHLKKLLEDDTLFLRDLSEQLESMSRNHTTQIFGEGIIVQGNDSVVIGDNGTYISGNISGSSIITNNSQVTNNKKE